MINNTEYELSQEEIVAMVTEHVPEAIPFLDGSWFSVAGMQRSECVREEPTGYCITFNNPPVSVFFDSLGIYHRN